MSLFGWGSRGRAPQAAPADQQQAGAGLTGEPFVQRTRTQLDQLAVLLADASGVISPTAYSLARQVDDILRPLVAYIELHPVIVDHEVLISSVLTDYVPAPVQTFLQLQPADQVGGGKADLLLRQQFATIRDNVWDLAESIRSAGIKELNVQANFIQARFEQGV